MFLIKKLELLNGQKFWKMINIAIQFDNLVFTYKIKYNFLIL